MHRVFAAGLLHAQLLSFSVLQCTRRHFTESLDLPALYGSSSNEAPPVANDVLAFRTQQPAGSSKDMVADMKYAGRLCAATTSGVVCALLQRTMSYSSAREPLRRHAMELAGALPDQLEHPKDLLLSSGRVLDMCNALVLLLSLHADVGDVIRCTEVLARYMEAMQREHARGETLTQCLVQGWRTVMVATACYPLLLRHVCFSSDVVHRSLGSDVGRSMRIGERFVLQTLKRTTVEAPGPGVAALRDVYELAAEACGLLSNQSREQGCQWPCGCGLFLAFSCDVADRFPEAWVCRAALIFVRDFIFKCKRGAAHHGTQADVAIVAGLLFGGMCRIAVSDADDVSAAKLRKFVRSLVVDATEMFLQDTKTTVQKFFVLSLREDILTNFAEWLVRDPLHRLSSFDDVMSIVLLRGHLSPCFTHIPSLAEVARHTRPSSSAAIYAALQRTQEAYGDWRSAGGELAGDHTKTVALGSVASWHTALAAVANAFASTAEPLASAVRGDWREAALPTAIRLCAEVGRHKDVFRLCDEYSLIGSADVVSGGLVQAVPLEPQAVFGLSKAVDETNQWYRAIDAVTALSQSYPSSSRLDRWYLERSVKHIASAVSSHWFESLRFLAVLLGGLPQLPAGQDVDSLVEAALPSALRAVASMPATPSGMQWQQACRLLLPLVGRCSQSDELSLARYALWAARVPSRAVAAVQALTARQLPRVSIEMGKQFARSGHWDCAFALLAAVAQRKEVPPNTVSQLWELAATSALHAYRANLLAVPPMHELLRLFPDEQLRSTRRLLRSIWRATDNAGTWEVLVARLQAIQGDSGSELYAEYRDAACILQKRELQPSRAELTLTDPFLVHYMCSTAAMHPLRSLSCKFVWTRASIGVLRGTCGGDLETYVTRVLNLSWSQVHTGDGKCGKQRVMCEGDSLRIFRRFRPHEQRDTVSTLAVVADCLCYSVCVKPAGVDSHMCANLLALERKARLGMVPLFQLPVPSEGLMVCVSPHVARAFVSCTMYVLLGLRRIEEQARCVSLCRFFATYRMSPLTVVDAGTVLPLSEIVVVEAVCESDGSGAAGTLYTLTMDLALEGWGYCGDPGNTFAETTMDGKAYDTERETRALFFLRELHLVAPLWENGLGRRSTRFEVGVPDWWASDGFLPAELIDTSGGDDDPTRHHWA